MADYLDKIFRVTANIQGASFTRPNNTTAYAAGDSVGATAGTVTEFAGAARLTGGSGIVKSVQLTKSRTGVTNASFRVHLYTASPALVADNAGFETVWAARATHIGYADLTLVTEGGTNDCPSAIAATNIPYTCAAGATSLYGVVCAEAAYGPYALEEFQVAITVDKE